jgi:hypothetical protein
MAVFEVWKSGSESLDQLPRNQSHRRSDDLPKHVEDTAASSIDSQIEDLVRAGVVTADIAVTHAMDARALAKKLGIPER